MPTNEKVTLYMIVRFITTKILKNKKNTEELASLSKNQRET